MIDAIDQILLDLLQENARLSNAELAEATGLSASSVFERVKKLERRGIITGYVATVDAEKLGKPLLAFIRVSLDVRGLEDYDATHENMLAMCLTDADILECHHVAGEDCFVLKVRAGGPKQLEALLSRIRRKAHMTRSVTNIVLSTVKETTRMTPEAHDEEENN